MQAVVRIKNKKNELAARRPREKRENKQKTPLFAVESQKYGGVEASSANFLSEAKNISESCAAGCRVGDHFDGLA